MKPYPHPHGLGLRGGFTVCAVLSVSSVEGLSCAEGSVIAHGLGGLCRSFLGDGGTYPTNIKAVLGEILMVFCQGDFLFIITAYVSQCDYYVNLFLPLIPDFERVGGV